MYTVEVAQLYELEHRDFVADVDLHLSYALLTGGPVLELGCGTARLMLPLVRAGYEVVGVDASPAMLSLARSKLSGAGPGKWKLMEAQLSDLGALPSGHFGLVSCALNTWAHLTSAERVLAVLRSVRRVLRPAGLLVIDLEDPEHRTRGAGELVLAGVFEDGLEMVTKTVATVYAPIEGVEDVTIIWDRVTDGAVRRIITRAQLRPANRSELEQLLALAGYSVREVLGSWEMEAYAARGDRLIVVAAAS